MRQTWRRQGLLIPAPTSQPWAHTHAALPVADPLGDGQLDVYYSPRDRKGRAHVAVARVQALGADGELVLVSEEPEPVLSPGTLGAFDESGVTVSCIVHCDGHSFLYFTGWTLGVSVPFYFYVGLAIQRAGETSFKRVSPAPVLERSDVDPYLTASPWVLREHGTWRMWYVSCVDWRVADAQPQHRYHIRYAESDDGILWRRDGRVSIDFADMHEYAISRPCVVRDDDCYRMWFAARGEQYRLGYAESPDGLSWTRSDSAVGLATSPGGWDSDMLAYPSVVALRGRRYLFYNGNDYGRTGIGYAIAA